MFGDGNGGRRRWHSLLTGLAVLGTSLHGNYTMILETVLSTKSIAHLQLEKENCKPLFFCDGIPFSFLKRRNDGRKQKKNQLIICVYKDKLVILFSSLNVTVVCLRCSYIAIREGNNFIFKKRKKLAKFAHVPWPAGSLFRKITQREKKTCWHVVVKNEVSTRELFK